MKAEGTRRGADHVRQLTILGDGAAWIWNIATAKFPGATQIVDLFHAREHLNDLARLLEFMLLDSKDDWLAQDLRILITATSTASAKPPASISSRALRKTSWARPSATSRTTRPACATSGSASAACSPAPASSKPAASQSVESAWGAVPGLLPARFPRPLAAPGVPVSGHRALHGLCRQAWLGAHGLGIVLPR